MMMHRWKCWLGKIWIAALVATGMGAGLASCGSDEPDEPKPVIEPDTCGRTLLVYMVANNNLGSHVTANDYKGYDGLDIEEMQIGAMQGALGGNRLLVYHAPYAADPALKIVRPDGSVAVLKQYDRSELSTSARRMEQVIEDVKSLSSSRRYGIVLWSHGSGWIEDGIKEELGGGVAGKSFGLDGGRTMNVTTLARVLDGKGFDYVYFDCCHMMGIEVAYELRHATGAVAGSCSELPSKGMPYDRTLRYLMAEDADLQGAVGEVFGYYDSLSGWERTCTISYVYTDGLDRVASAAREIFAATPVKGNSSEVQRFIEGGRYFDFLDYMAQLAGVKDGGAGYSAELAASYERLKLEVENAVGARHATPWLWYGEPDALEINTHCGLSTYIVERAGGEATLNYSNLSWWGDVASAQW